MTQQIPLQAGQKFRVNFDRDRWYLKHEFEVRTVLSLSTVTAYSAYVCSRKTGERLGGESNLAFFFDHQLVTHAKRGELQIAKAA